MMVAAARVLAASVLLISTAILVLHLGSPFTYSAMASTTAIVLHRPRRFRSHPQTIAACYLFGLMVSVPISLAGALLGLAGLLAASVSAALVVANARGRRHPPTTCIPFAVTTATGAAQVLTHWFLFTATAVCWLALLWLMSFTHSALRASPSRVQVRPGIR